MKEIDFDPTTMTLATPADIFRIYRQLWGEQEIMKIIAVHTPAVLVTGVDLKGNEYCHQFARGQYMDLYNEVYITEERFRALYPIVQKVYFGETEMTGDQWRDIQCPLSMTREQIDQWRENVQYVDVWADPQYLIEDTIVDTGLTDDRPYRSATSDGNFPF